MKKIEITEVCLFGFCFIVCFLINILILILFLLFIFFGFPLWGNATGLRSGQREWGMGGVGVHDLKFPKL